MMRGFPITRSWPWELHLRIHQQNGRVAVVLGVNFRQPIVLWNLLWSCAAVAVIYGARVLGCWDVGTSVKALCCWGGRLFSTEVADTAGFGLRECGASFSFRPTKFPRKGRVSLNTTHPRSTTTTCRQPRKSRPLVVPPAGPPSWESQRPF